MSEAGKKLSEVATQKSSEVYGTVSDKVRQDNIHFVHLYYLFIVFSF